MRQYTKKIKFKADKCKAHIFIKMTKTSVYHDPSMDPTLKRTDGKRYGSWVINDVWELL